MTARLSAIPDADEGHRAIIEEGGWIRVRSDSYAQKSYHVEFHAVQRGDGMPVMFSCSPIGRSFDDHGATRSKAPGVPCCKHAAVAARTLARFGLARLNGDGRWVAVVPVDPALADAG